MNLTVKQFRLFRKSEIQFVQDNLKVIFQSIFTVLSLALAVWFFQHEQAELHQVKHVLSTSRWAWIIVGTLLTIFYIILQAMMYINSFAAIGTKLSWADAIVLFLKRNFVSVFLPAGGISSLAFFSKPIENKGITKAQVHFASSIYAFVGILSVVIVAIPAFLVALTTGGLGYGEWIALGTTVVLIIGAYAFYRSFRTQGFLYQKLVDQWPVAQEYLDDLISNKIHSKFYLLTVFYSVVIELTGIAHLYVAMLALHLEPSLSVAILGYITSVILLIVSPFLRGIGAIEFSMTYVLIRFGFSNVDAISVTFFYRFFEFWLPLVFGALSFLIKINKLLLRIFPAVLLFILGIINIISVVTPAIGTRLHFLKEFLPMSAIAVSNFFVLLTGLFLLVTAAFLFKGLRMAWYFAIALCFISLVGNLTKAIDYEESTFSLVVGIILLVSKKDYYIKNSRRSGIMGIVVTSFSCVAVLIYGCIGFYFLDEKHFGIDFSFKQSVTYTFANFFLVGSADLNARDDFARDFLYTLNISGFLSISFLVYALVRPYFVNSEVYQTDLEWAKAELDKYGNSALDYFKSYFDKLIFRCEGTGGFVSYRIVGNFAVVLECPVAPKEKLMECTQSFDEHCVQQGLKSIYFRVPEEKLFAFPSKKKLFLGQEGVLDLTSFSMDGGAKKSIRNAIKKVKDQGFVSKIYSTPVGDDLLSKLEAVSNEWLSETDRSEIVFSQGMFMREELRHQTIITIENNESKVFAFLNIIPDFAPGEGTYDLIRKTKDAPNGVIDFIMVEMFYFLKANGYSSVNLGFAPLSGIADPRNFPERSMKFAYEKIRSFSHYQGLRAYKEKFSPEWHNKYLLYDQDFDLFKVPGVLTKVIKP